MEIYDKSFANYVRKENRCVCDIGRYMALIINDTNYVF
jgi:hypothetical protein